MTRAVQRRYRERRQRDNRTIQAIAVVFAGALFSIATTATLDGSLLGGALLAYGLMAAAGATGVALLGFCWPESFAGRPSASGWLFGVAAAAAMLAVSLVYVMLLGASTLDTSAWSPPGALLVITAVLLPAFVEEWLCRGVLWIAARRLMNERQTIVVTAVLFGLLHVLTWGPFGFPNRAVGGLVLGHVRARTRSLAPCVLAHLINNFVAAGFLEAL